MRSKNTKTERIQLRGISRSPSNRATADGGVAESINLHLQEGESVPALSPIDVTAEKGIPTTFDGDVLFIHRTAVYDHFICMKGNALYWYGEDAVIEDGAESTPILELPEGTGVKDITSVGNTIVVATTDKTHYLYFKDGGYVYLGTDILFPQIQIVQEEQMGLHASSTIPQSSPSGESTAVSGGVGSGGFDDGSEKEDDPANPPGGSGGGGTGGSTGGSTGGGTHPDDGEGSGGIHGPGFPDDGEGDDTGDSDGGGQPIPPSPVRQLGVRTSFAYNSGMVSSGRIAACWYAGNYMSGEQMIHQGIYESEPIFVNSIQTAFETSYYDDTDLVGMISDKKDDSGMATIAVAGEILDFVQGIVREQDRDNAMRGIYSYPVWAMTGVTLYDGTVITSTPTLLGAGFDYPYDITFFMETPRSRDEAKRVRFTPYIEHKNAYTIALKMLTPLKDLELWKDVITGIKVYTSAPVGQSLAYSNRASLKVLAVDGDNSIGTMTLGAKDYDFKEDLLDKSQFYEVESYGADGAKNTWSSLVKGVTVNSKKKILQDELLDPLNKFEMKHTAVSYGSVMTYNNRLLGWDAKRSIVSLDANMTAVAHIKASMTSYLVDKADLENQHFKSVVVSRPAKPVDEKDIEVSMRLTWTVRTDTGDIRVTTRNGTLDNFFRFNKDNRYTTHIPYGMLMFPDRRAVKVEIEVVTPSSTGTMVLDLVEHPWLDAAYWYGDIKTPLVDYKSFIQDYYVPTEELIYEEVGNTLFVSGASQPFIPESSHAFTGRIIGVAGVTNAISEGQFGQFPLYIFTSDGIWVMEVNSLGEPLSFKPSLRNVAINPDIIVPTDNSVVFLDPEGIKLLQGNAVTSLSQYMNGAHFSIRPESAESRILSELESQSFMSTIEDDTVFMKYMKTAEGAYDYPGRRLVFFSREDPYQYVLKLDTMTWHKYVEDTAQPKTFSKVLNSYPDALVAMKDSDGHTHVLNYSTPLDVTSEEQLNGVIVTRPFDLGNPDVLKKITAVKIRGQYRKGNVRYILLGSQDGIRFHMVHSLFGKAWKVFQIIVVAKLQPTETITYLDIEYETRYENRMR